MLSAVSVCNTVSFYVLMINRHVIFIVALRQYLYRAGLSYVGLIFSSVSLVELTPTVDISYRSISAFDDT